MRVKTKTVIVFTVLLIVAGCGGEAERHDAEAENAAPVSVQVEKVKALGVMSAHQAVGTVHSKDGSTLSSKVVGNVLAVHVREGDRVRSGQLLVEIDSREADARVRQAEAGMVEAESALVEVESGILAARSGIDAAEANAKLAKSTYDRCVDLMCQIPNSRPVAFRFPCMDSLNTPSPRAFAEIINQTTQKGNFLQLSTSVTCLFTPQDPSIRRHFQVWPSCAAKPCSAPRRGSSSGGC